MDTKSCCTHIFDLDNLPPKKRSILIDFLNVFLDKNLIFWKDLKPYIGDITKEESYEAIRNTPIGRFLLRWGNIGKGILEDLKKGSIEKIDPQAIQDELENYGLGNKLATLITSIIVAGIVTGVTYTELDKKSKNKHKHNKKIEEIKEIRRKYNL